MTITVYHYMALSAILFAMGVFGVLARKNVLGILMSLELMFNAAMINFVASNVYLHPETLRGQGFSLFVIVLAAAEAVVGLSLVVAIYRTGNGK